MINLGLSSAELKLFQQSLITGYNLKVTVQILDLNHKYIADVSEMLMDGQVNKGFWDIVTSGATLTLLDPDFQTGFDTASPSDGAIYADRMIRIVYSTYSADLLPRWVDVPIFCGPVTKVSRDDAVLSVECQGKESLYVEPTMVWTSKTYAKGTKLVSAVKDLLGSKGGETKFDLPEWTRTIKKDYSLKTETRAWDLVRSMVGSRLIHQAFYDGRGYFRLRNCPTTPIFTITEDHLTSVPKLEYDTANLRNTVLAKGATPTGKSQLISKRYLPSSNPSSPSALARNGVKRYLVEVIEDGDLTTQSAVDSLANETLESVQLEQVNFDFDSVPLPHLEPGDVFQIKTRDFSRNLRHKEFSIPLKAGNAQSNGTYRRLTANKTNIRKKK